MSIQWRLLQELPLSKCENNLTCDKRYVTLGEKKRVSYRAANAQAAYSLLFLYLYEVV